MAEASDAAATVAGSTASFSTSLLTSLVESAQRPARLYIYAAIVLALTLLLSYVQPKIDPREPKVLRPKIPLVGHILGLMRKQTDFLTGLRQTTDLPIATLPMLNGKVYAVFDPILVQEAFRNDKLSMDPTAVANSQKMFDLNDATMHSLETTDIVTRAWDINHAALAGQHGQRLKSDSLHWIADKMNTDLAGDDWLEIPNFWLWTRDTLTSVTCETLYGRGNPFRGRSDLYADFLEFEQGILAFILGFFPKIVAAKPWAARARLQAVLLEYYGARCDEQDGTSELIRGRARMLREKGWTAEFLSHLELGMAFASVVNMIPSLYWLACNILRDGELVAKLREELHGVVEHQSNKAMVDVSKIDQECPLLMSCYQENMRLATTMQLVRHVTEDTTISDGKGNTYLLKAGFDVHLSTKSSHMMGHIWGEDVREFRADRFLPARSKGSSAAANTKVKRAAYYPFGGGHHLCPGQGFARIQILTVMATLILGFDVKPLHGEEWVIPERTRPSLAESVPKPVRNGQGLGVRIRRRQGWEKTEWVYKS